MIKQYINIRYMCMSGLSESDNSLEDDQDEDEEDVDATFDFLGFGALRGIVSAGNRHGKKRDNGDNVDWWEVEARRCRDTGSLVDECICGECEIYREMEMAVGGD
jgi:hypothetical protein